jgi:hypothetical protein
MIIKSMLIAAVVGCIGCGNVFASTDQLLSDTYDKCCAYLMHEAKRDKNDENDENLKIALLCISTFSRSSMVQGLEEIIACLNGTTEEALIEKKMLIENKALEKNSAHIKDYMVKNIKNGNYDNDSLKMILEVMTQKKVILTIMEHCVLGNMLNKLYQKAKDHNNKVIFSFSNDKEDELTQEEIIEFANIYKEVVKGCA